MAEASFTDVLQDRTHKYRRTFMALCLIIIAVYYLPIRFDDLQLFGVRPEQGYPHTHLIVIVTLWIVWVYHAGLVSYYTQRDWKDWCSQLHGGDKTPRNWKAFPEIRMYFPKPEWWKLKWWWGCPSNQLSQARQLHDWKYLERDTDNAAIWIGQPIGQGTPQELFKISIDNARSVYSRVRWFFVVDCGFPSCFQLLP
jgi:hypothetical protein